MRILSSSDGHIALYIDGSCLENQNVTAETPAAWGMAIVVGDNGLGRGFCNDTSYASCRSRSGNRDKACSGYEDTPDVNDKSNRSALIEEHPVASFQA